MATAQQVNEIYQYTVGLFDAAPGVYMDGLTDFVDGGNTTGEMAAAIAGSAAFSALYPDSVTDDVFLTAFLGNLFDGNVAQETAGIAQDYLKGMLDAGQTRAQVAVYAVDYVASGVDASDPDFGAAHQSLLASAASASSYQLMPGEAGLSGNMAVLQDVIANAGGNADQFLQDGFDNLLGGIGNDTFVADILDNSNTFESGDRVDGGAGFDTMDAEIGLSQDFAITAKTDSVERFDFTAQSNNWEAEGGNDLSVGNIDFGAVTSGFNAAQVDAQYMNGLEQLWSVNSRADLVIEDVRAKSNATTIGFRDADGGNVDLGVFFDDQYICANDEFTQGALLTLQVADLEKIVDAGKDGQTLSATDPDVFGDITALLDRLDITLDEGAGTIHTFSVDMSGVTDIQNLVDDINAAFAADNYTTLVASVDENYKAVASSGEDCFPAGIRVVNSGSGELTKAEFTPVPGADNLSSEQNFHSSATTALPDTLHPVTSTNLIFDNVGHNGDAGDVIVGSMIDTQHAGIQQFNIEVQRDSMVDHLASTNNTLEIVKVVNGDAGDNDGCSASNGNLSIQHMYDVQDFDASAMTGNVDLTATLSALVTDKYMDLRDTDGPAADNIAFTYDFGTGDDKLNLAISDSNFDAAGTTTREDFTLAIDGNDGADNLTFSIVDANDAFSNGNGTNWYSNSHLNANLTIDAGAGDDVVARLGSGDVTIDAGAGNDVVYVDNTGDKASFVFNTADQQTAVASERIQDDLNSDGINTYDLSGGDKAAMLTVNFKGFSSAVALADGVDAQTVTDLDINQAIKHAIDDDFVLGSMLSANDGPANTLVVTSLIDGVQTTADLTVTVADTAGANFALTNDYTTALENDGAFDIAGSESVHVGDNHIAVSAGDDVFVLGTGANSNDLLVIEENFGNDVVVNFNADAADSIGDDVIDFTSIGATQLTLGGTFLAGNALDDAHVADISATANIVPGHDNGYDVSYNGDDLGTLWFGTDDLAGFAADNVKLVGSESDSADVISYGNGAVAPAPAGVMPVDLVVGTSAPVAATAAAEQFSFDAVTALGMTANTQIVINGFDTAADSLQLDIATAGAVATLADLNGVDGIAVQTNAITDMTTINFGNDADGDVVSIQLTGIVDASLVAVDAV